MLTPYQIADMTEHLDGIANTRVINNMYRLQDESHLWPICGRFNATERAIRKARKHMSDCGEVCEGLAYCLTLEQFLSDIVNGEVG